MVYSKLWIPYCQILLSTCIKLLLPSWILVPHQNSSLSLSLSLSLFFLFFFPPFPLFISDAMALRGPWPLLGFSTISILSFFPQFLTPASLCQYSLNQSILFWAFLPFFSFCLGIRNSFWCFAIILIICPGHLSLAFFILQLVLLTYVSSR